MIIITARNKIVTSVGILLAVLCAAGETGEAQTQPTIAGVEPVSIMSVGAANIVVRFAEQELQRYLQAVTGQAVEIGNPRAKHRIFLGEIPQTIPPESAQKLRKDLDSLRDDGFVVRRVGPDIVISGKGSRGALYGCYALLEHLGVRWFFPGKKYEVVLHRTIDWSARIDMVESPSFRERILFHWANSYAPTEDWIDFAAKVRLNGFKLSFDGTERDWYINLRSRLRPELEKRGMIIEVGGHLLTSFLPRSLFKNQPDWFRMNEQGQRVNDFNLNPFNAQALHYLASGVVEYFLRTPESSLFHAWADDIEGGGWSIEPGREEYTPSDQALLVYNYLARQLRERLPEANVAFLAYHDTVFPPRIVKPGPGIIYFYAPRERCYAHALNDPACSLNQKYSKALEEALPSFGSDRAEVFEYYVDQILYENLTNPPLPQTLSADAQYYHRLGIPAMGALLTNTSEFVTPMVNMFLYPRALWNIGSDLRASLKDYSAVYFGDPLLEEYFRELEEGLKDVLKICDYSNPGSAWDSIRVDQESDDALARHVQGIEKGLRGPLDRAATLLQAAVSKAKNRQYKERLWREQLQMDFTLGQAKLFYHMLKSEWLYRVHKHGNDREAGLGALNESILARFSWENQKKLIARSGLKGDPLLPDPGMLQGQVNELLGEGYTLESLYQYLDGLSGYLATSPSASSVVLWTDLKTPVLPSGSASSRLDWRGEFGQPIWPFPMHPVASAVVVEGKGMSSHELFDALALGLQRK